VGNPAATKAAAPSGPVSSSGSGGIATFEQAMARMQVWPRALNRQSHTGPIEEIVPFEDLLNGGGQEDLETPENALLGPNSLVEMTPPPAPEAPQVAFEDLGLELTTTAIFGKNRFAVIEGKRYQEGELLEIQVGQATVRYEVSAILPRAVELRDGETVHVLRIASSGLQVRDSDGA